MRAVIDIETNGLRQEVIKNNYTIPKATKIHCIVAKDIDTGKVYPFPPDMLHGFRDWSVGVEKFIMHNGISFDGFILNKFLNTNITTSKVIDTMLLSQLVDPLLDGGHSLKMWGIRLGLPKGDMESFEEYNPDMLDYCIQDVEITHALFNKLSKSPAVSQQSLILEQKVRQVIDKQEENGFAFNLEEATKLFCSIEEERKSLETEAVNTFPPKEIKLKTKTNYKPFNIGSRQQQVEVLISKGWKPKDKTDKGNVILNETILSNIDLPEAKMFNRFLLLQKRSAQIKSWIESCDEDNRVRGKVRTLSTVTGRTSANSPNMQQVPANYSPFGKECRNLWTISNPKTHKLVGTDASGLELRCLAHYMYKVGREDAKKYTDTILNGDVHTTNMKLAGLHNRDQAKTFIYAFLYGAGAFKIGNIVGKGRTAGQALINRFLQRLPSLDLLRKQVTEASAKGFLRGLDGRRLKIRSQHSALNTLIQGAGAVVCKQWLVHIMERVIREKLDVKLVASIHDEYQFEVLNKDVDRFCVITKEAIHTTTKTLDLKCPLDNEYNVGTTWLETH